MKAYTDLNQSKKLAKILPLESADMVLLHEEPYETSDSKFDGLHQALCVPFNKYDKSWRQKYKNISYFPCWSLAALLGVLPSVIKRTGKRMFLTLEKAGAYNLYYKSPDRLDELWETKEDIIDACYDMILNLHELKML